MVNKLFLNLLLFGVSVSIFCGCESADRLNSVNKALTALLNGGFQLKEAEIISVEIERLGKINKFDSTNIPWLADRLHDAVISSSNSLVRANSLDKIRVGEIRIETAKGRGSFYIYELKSRSKIYAIKIINSGDIGSGYAYLIDPAIEVLK